MAQNQIADKYTRSLITKCIGDIIQLDGEERVALIFTAILNPLGEDKHPGKWSDNLFLTKLELYRESLLTTKENDIYYEKQGVSSGD